MEEFTRQIIDDISIIKRDFAHIDEKILKNDYAFNYWVLSRLYNIDEELIPSYVTDINDKNIDCFVHFEDTKELFIIQNKYYSSDTCLSRETFSDFLKTPLSVLLRGCYTRSEELQKIFDKVHSDSEYKIWLHFYLTNNSHNSDIDDLVENFDYNNERVKAFVGVKFYYLNDIKNIYYEERFANKTSFTAILPTKVRGTSLDVRPRDYELPWMIDVRYVMVNVAELYRMYEEAIRKNYEIFEENIREYLGTEGINNSIIRTLKSDKDRENFFYYNNGITIICEKCDTLRGTEASRSSGTRYQYGFELRNPQIINGCQTINSIYEVLSHYSDDRIDKEFEKAFVLVKIFVFDEETKNQKPDLDKNIVKYTNSQNAINEKAFASKKSFFSNIQKEFYHRGVLLLVKPSDKNKFTREFLDKLKFAELRKKSKDLYDLFGLRNDRPTDLMIPLEKLLQVLLAFQKDGYAAFTKKNSVLKPNSPMYKDFSMNIETFFTIDNMINLYMLYNKAEIEKKESDDKRTPIPYYVIGFVGQIFKDKTFDEVNDKLYDLFSAKDKLYVIYEFCKNLTAYYSEEYCRENQSDYNKMIKQEIDYPILDRCIHNQLRFSSDNQEVKDFFRI